MNRLMCLLMGAFFLVASLLSGCGGGGGGGSGNDKTAPTVSSVSPPNNAIGVGTNTSISATFSEPMAIPPPGSLPFSLVPTAGGAAVTGTLSFSGTTATFTPTAALAASTQYTATITTAVTDLAGNALAAPFIWTFTTGAGADTTPPTVSATNPANNAIGVALNSSVSATFSEAMRNATLDTTSFILVETLVGNVTGTVSVTGNTATFAPLVNLLPFTQYTATITSGATDAAGNALAAPYSWTFTTGAMADMTPPIVSFTSPANGATNVALNSSVSSATFSEPMNNATLTTASFTLVKTSDGDPVIGTVNVNGNTAALTPLGSLLPFTNYTATVSTAATDAAGNPLAAFYSWSFTTGAAPDTTPPTVASTNPLNGAVGVAPNASISATFDEPMTNASLNTASIFLAPTAGGPAVAGTVSVSGNTATFTPLANLAGSIQYTATITTAAMDASGNTLAAPFSWSFTTSAIPDTTPPTVLLPTSPADLAVGVPLNSSVSATFSEPMANGTLTNTSFTLVRTGGMAVAGTVLVSANTATFTPSANLAAGVNYTATITTAATDAAGNALAANVVWMFTALADTTPPTVIATSVPEGATNVSLNATVSATFSEAMNNATLTAANFTLVEFVGGAPVAGTVNVSGNTVTFTPTAPLTLNTQYTATITTNVTDAAVPGNMLLMNFTLNFTTSSGALAACPTTPTFGTLVGAITPNLSVSRASGTGPLAVFFDASATTHTNMAIKPYHDIEYRWDFGDPAGGATWSVGNPSVNSRNAARGPVAAHVFDPAPGSGTQVYTVTLTAFDGSASIATFSCQITVTDANADFTANTLCVSNSPDFTGCPVCAAPSAICVVSADFDNVINTLAGNGGTRKRILFKGGDTFTASQAGMLTASGPGLVGVFPAGGGKANVVGTTVKFSLGTAGNPAFGDWRIVDLSLSGGGTFGIGHGGTSSRVTIQRVDIDASVVGISADINTLDFVNPGAGHALYNELAIVDSRITNSIEYGFFGAVSRLMMLGNLINSPPPFNPLSQHGARLQYGREIVISNNDLLQAFKTSLTVRGVIFNTINRNPLVGHGAGITTLPDMAFTEKGVISDNRMLGSIGSGGAGAGTTPLTFQSTSGAGDTRFRNHIVERNSIVLGSSASGAAMQFESSFISIRNNLFDTSAANAAQLAMNIQKSTAAPPLTEMYVHNNSVFSNKAGGSLFTILNTDGSLPTNVKFRINLGRGPNLTGAANSISGTYGAGSDSPATADNSTSAQIRQGLQVLTVEPPVTPPNDWRPLGGSYPIGGGFSVNVFSDYAAQPRIGNHIGAVNP